MVTPGRISLILLAGMAGILCAVAAAVESWNRNSALVAAVNSGDTASATRLLESGAAPDTREQDTPLLLVAALAGRAAIAEQLMRHGAGVNVADRSGTTPLIAAARNGDRELARRLIRAGADVEAHDDSGMTALMLAAWSGNRRIVEDLVAAGARICPAGKSESPALCFAAYGGHGDEVRYLAKEAGRLPGPAVSAALLSAVWSGKVGVVEETLRLGADVNVRDTHNRTALILAVERGNEPIVALLLQWGADAQAVGQGGTALQVAIRDHRIAIKHLLEGVGHGR